jgi:hypothetical protein
MRPKKASSVPWSLKFPYFSLTPKNNNYALFTNQFGMIFIEKQPFCVIFTVFGSSKFE